MVVLGLKCRQWKQYLNAFSQPHPDKYLQSSAAVARICLTIV